MIYNLHKYLETKFNTETFYVNLRSTTFPEDAVPDRCVLLSQAGGSEGAWFHYRQTQITFTCRDIDQVKSKSLADKIYDELKGRFGLILPAVSVGGTLHPQIQTGQISAQNIPQCTGEDENGRPEFSFTIIVKDVGG